MVKVDLNDSKFFLVNDGLHLGDFFRWIKVVNNSLYICKRARTARLTIGEMEYNSITRVILHLYEGKVFELLNIFIAERYPVRNTHSVFN